MGFTWVPVYVTFVVFRYIGFWFQKYTNNVGWPLGTAAKTTMINIAEKLTQFLNFYLKAPILSLDELTQNLQGFSNPCLLVIMVLVQIIWSDFCHKIFLIADITKKIMPCHFCHHQFNEIFSNISDSIIIFWFPIHCICWFYQRVHELGIFVAAVSVHCSDWLIWKLSKKYICGIIDRWKIIFH